MWPNSRLLNLQYLVSPLGALGASWTAPRPVKLRPSSTFNSKPDVMLRGPCVRQC